VEAEKVFVAPCDMSTITAELILGLCDEYKKEYDAVILLGQDGKCYPTIGVYSKRLLPVFKDRIENKEYRLMGLLRECNVRTVPIQSPAIRKVELLNLNTWEDYIKIKKYS